MTSPRPRPENIAAFAAEHEVALGDGTVRNDAAVNFIRERWIERQLLEREAEFADLVEGSVCCATWNVNGKKLEEEDSIEDWIPVEVPEALCDVYAIGFQEMVDLTVANVTMDGKAAQRHKFWMEKLLTHLNRNRAGETYECVGHEHLVGILLCVFVKRRLASVVSQVQMQNVACGAMGVMGNKGGVVGRLKLYDSWICFVCAHLAAHRGNVEGRNANASTILEKGAFGSEVVPLRRSYEEVQPIRIMEHEFVFFLGDLNYRVSAEVDIEEVFWKCTEDLDAPFLLSRDQLNIERQAGRVLEGFREAAIGFMPTYKFEPGSDRYEMRETKKRRAPAWCDRVLWYSKRPERASSTLYRATTSQRISDHKPVVASFGVRARRVDKPRAMSVLGSVTRHLDRWENAAQPRVDLSTSELRFGSIRYDEEALAELTLRNVGETPAVFRFVPKNDPDDPMPVVCKRWCHIDPAYGMLLPGESRSITLACSIDSTTSRQLALAEDTLDDILILRLEGGMDCFVDISAEYLRSCFGCSLEELVHAPAPIREVPIGGPAVVADGQTVQAVPKELWRVLDALQSLAPETPDLFFGQAVYTEVAELREALDTGADFPAHSPHSMADLLLTFLASLASPIIPRSVALSLEAEYTTQNLQPWTRRFLERLPPPNYNTFVYLVSFFRFLLEHKQQNRLTPHKIASTLSRTLLAQLPEDLRKGGDRKTMGGMLGNTYDDVVDGTDDLSELAAAAGKVNPVQRRNNLDMIVVHLLTTSVI